MPLSGPQGVTTSAAMVGYIVSCAPPESKDPDVDHNQVLNLLFFFARVSKYRLLNFLLPAYPLIIQLTFGRDARPWKYVCSDADCRAGGVRRPLNEPPGAENRQELTETGSQICAQTTPRRILSGTHSRCNVHLAERLIRSLWLSADLYILSAFLPEGHLADHEYRRTTR